MPNKEKYTNLSIAGDKSQALGLFQKIGSTLFLFGIIGLYFVYGAKKENQALMAISAFGLQLLGAFFFTYQGGKIAPFSGRRNYFSALKLISYVLTGISLSVLFAAWLGWLPSGRENEYFAYLMLPFTLAIILFSYAQYVEHPAGIKNNNVYNSSLTGRGVLGWMVGIGLTLFYIELYWNKEAFPQLIALFDSLSFLLRGKAADRWFLYGTFYTFVILFLGIKL